MKEIITLERLQVYTDEVKELDYLLKRKESLAERIGNVHGIDYSRIKVTTGNGQKDSEQENYTMTLQKINASIDELKFKLAKEHEIIKACIAKVKKWNYRKILVLRYLEKRKWSEIIEEFFGLEEDFDEEKNYKYKDKIFYWNRQALARLEEINS